MLKTFMKKYSPISPATLKSLQWSLHFLHLGRVAIGLFSIGSYIVQVGGWTVQVVNYH